MRTVLTVPSTRRRRGFFEVAGPGSEALHELLGLGAVFGEHVVEVDVRGDGLAWGQLKQLVHAARPVELPGDPVVVPAAELGHDFGLLQQAQVAGQLLLGGFALGDVEVGCHHPIVQLHKLAGVPAVEAFVSVVVFQALRLPGSQHLHHEGEETSFAGQAPGYSRT